MVKLGNSCPDGIPGVRSTSPLGLLFFFLRHGRYSPPRQMPLAYASGARNAIIQGGEDGPGDQTAHRSECRFHSREQGATASPAAQSRAMPKSVLTAGGLPVLMPIFDKEAEIRAFLEHVDGFILTGGLDMDPRRLGLPRHHAVQPMAERREESDRILVRLLIERQMPVLGIGVGMHQLNVACGGNLFHAPARRLPALDAALRSVVRRAAPPSRQPARPARAWKSSTAAPNCSSTATIIKPSSKSAPRFRVAATAPDGVIEAIEAVDPNWFCIGVQWHPEADSSSRPRSATVRVLRANVSAAVPALALAA